MDLNELQKRLYKKDDAIEGRPKAPEEFEAGHQSAAPPEPAPQWSAADADLPLWTVRKKWLFRGAIASGIVLIVGSLIWYIWASRYSFDKDAVVLDIYGQERVVSGEEVNYVVRYKNNTSASLNNVVLEFYFAEQSLPYEGQNISHYGNQAVATKNLGEISAGQEGQAEFKAQVMGDQDSQQKFLAKLKYRPSNMNSEFLNEADFLSTVVSVPLVLNFDLPERLVSGQTINFTLKYLNTSDVIFSDTKIQMEYPDGFVFDSALPSPEEGNNIWSLSEIAAQEEGRIIIKGTLNGAEGETKSFRAKIGVQKDDTFAAYAQTLSSPEISVSPLWVEQSISEGDNLTANLGQILNYQLKYRNTTSVAIGPVIVQVRIDSRAFEPSSVSVQRGFFSSSDNTITWNAGSAPELNMLEGRQEGELSFSLRLKDKLPVNNFSDKNFVVLTTAQIDSPNVPLALVGTQLKGTNQLTVKVNSRLSLNVKGFYNDSLMSNSGPLPPRVGQRTTYTIYWQLLNVSNELKEVSVEATLPSYVQWVNSVYPAGENITYDPATGRVVWKIGKLAAGTGILSAVRQVVFQIALTPSISQVGQTVELVNNAAASGHDTFTDAALTTSAITLKSDLPDDPAVGWNNGRVQN